MSETDRRLRLLEARLQSLEDERDITRLILSYGPLVDSGTAKEVAGLWEEDGVYDVDELRMEGQAKITAMVRSSAHQKWLEDGCAHFQGPPHVTVTGDRAVAVSYSLMVVHEAPSKGFRVHRGTANRWELHRSSHGWRVTARTSRVLDGRSESPELLLGALRGTGLDS